MFSRLIKICRYLAVPLGWTIFTQILVSIPGKYLEGPGLLFNIPHIDKMAHIILFGGLAIFWILFLYAKNPEKKYTGLIVVLFLAAYGIGIEYYQLNFIPNRSFDVGDIVADICGALCGYFATIFILRYGRAGKMSR